MVELPKMVCRVCGHEWNPHYNKIPKVCAKCKSYKWNGETKPIKQEQPAQPIITKPNQVEDI